MRPGGYEMSADDGIGKSISDFFASLTKEPAEEFGGMLADRIRFWRIKQAVGLKEKTEAFLRQRGVTDRRAIPLKLTVAIVDGGTIEEDDDLHTMWAKLLTNALDPQFTAEVRYAYTEILRALSPFDVRTLNEIYKQTADLSQSLNRAEDYVHVDLSQISRQVGSNKEEMLLSADCLMRQRLIYPMLNFQEGGQVISHEEGEIKWVNPPPLISGISQHRVALTQLGFAFVRACQ